MTGKKESYRHILLIRRHDGQHVGFLCPDDDLEMWRQQIEWGTIVASVRIKFTDDSKDAKVQRKAVRGLYDTLDTFAATVQAGGHDLLHAIEQMIGMAFEAGLSHRTEPAVQRPDREAPFTD